MTRASGGEDHADLGRGRGQDVPALGPLPQPEGTGHTEHDHADVHRDGDRARGCRSAGRPRPAPRRPALTTRPRTSTATVPTAARGRRARGWPGSRCGGDVDDRRAGAPGRSGRRRHSVLQEGAEGEHPERDVDAAKTASRPHHGHPSPGVPCQRRLERPGGTDQDRGHDREQQQRQQRLPHPQAGGEDAVEATGGGQPHGRGQARRGQQHRTRPGRRRRGRRPRPAARLEDQELRGRGRRPCPGRRAAGSRPERRRASRTPSAVSRAKARCTARRVESRTATQNSPAVARSRMPAVGVEGEGEQDEHEQGERGHLVGGHPGPALDAQVLAGDQAGRHASTGGLLDDRATGPRPSRPAPRRPGWRGPRPARARGRRGARSPRRPPRRRSGRRAGRGPRRRGRRGARRAARARAAGDQRGERRPPALAGRQAGDRHVRSRPSRPSRARAPATSLVGGRRRPGPRSATFSATVRSS